MNVRERTEEIERLTLAPWATFSDASRGRQRQEEPDDIRPVFQRDRDRVIHCKAFRRLKQKTQVFLSPEGDLYRTRLTHTLEVTQVARTIARALRLNEDLTEAIGLAHDLGHTPFGHAGEAALNKLCPDGFKHYMQSLRVVDKLEKEGRSILAHSDGDVGVGAEEHEAFLALKDFMYANVYVDRTAKREEQKVEKVLTELYEYYLTHIDQMSNFYLQLAYQEGRERAVTDYISGMSDEFAIRTFEDVFVPRKWHVL